MTEPSLRQQAYMNLEGVGLDPSPGNVERMMYLLTHGLPGGGDGGGARSTGGGSGGGSAGGGTSHMDHISGTTAPKKPQGQQAPSTAPGPASTPPPNSAVAPPVESSHEQPPQPTGLSPGDAPSHVVAGASGMDPWTIASITGVPIATVLAYKAMKGKPQWAQQHSDEVQKILQAEAEMPEGAGAKFDPRAPAETVETMPREINPGDMGGMAPHNPRAPAPAPIPPPSPQLAQMLQGRNRVINPGMTVVPQAPKVPPPGMVNAPQIAPRTPGPQMPGAIPTQPPMAPQIGGAPSAVHAPVGPVAGAPMPAPSAPAPPPGMVNAPQIAPSTPGPQMPGAVPTAPRLASQIGGAPPAVHPPIGPGSAPAPTPPEPPPPEEPGGFEGDDSAFRKQFFDTPEEAPVVIPEPAGPPKMVADDLKTHPPAPTPEPKMSEEDTLHVPDEITASKVEADLFNAGIRGYTTKLQPAQMKAWVDSLQPGELNKVIKVLTKHGLIKAGAGTAVDVVRLMRGVMRGFRP